MQLLKERSGDDSGEMVARLEVDIKSVSAYLEFWSKESVYKSPENCSECKTKNMAIKKLEK